MGGFRKYFIAANLKTTSVSSWIKIFHPRSRMASELSRLKLEETTGVSQWSFIKLLPIFILIILSIWAGKGLFKYKAFSTHDGNHHIARSFDAVLSFSEGHFPLRWAGSLNYWCGVPVFNFFYPLLYYLVVLINPLFDNVIFSLKIIDFSTFFVASIFFYLWIKVETKDRLIALSSAILYLYAPYRFLLVFVRGSPEFMAYAVLPVLLYLYSLAFEEKNFKRFVLIVFLSALTGGILAISHNFTVMFLMPIVFLYLIFKFLSQGFYFHHPRSVILIVFSFISTFGLGAFFIFPAILEEKYTQISTPRFLYKDHFPALWQLFRSRWDYFYSAVGTELDGMSFQLGYAHWVVLGVGALSLIVFTIRGLRKTQVNKLWNLLTQNAWILSLFVISCLSIFLMLKESVFVWEAISVLQKIQFPWRILGISVFAISAFFAFMLSKIKRGFFYWILIIFVPLLAFFGNRNHLLPQPVVYWEGHLYDDFDKLHYHRHTTTTFADDILPPGAKTFCWYDTPLILLDGQKVQYKKIEKGSTFGTVKFMLPDKGQKLNLALSYFPNAYRFELNGNEIPFYDCEGRVCLDAKEAKLGPNIVSWKIVQTPVQSFFNKITLIFLGVWFIILFLTFTTYRPKKNHILLGLIFALFIFFRFYNIERRIAFGWDQERDAVSVMQIISGDIKLIGPRVLSDTGFFLPPYFFYMLVPFYKIYNGSPYAMIGFLFFYNITFFVLSYIFLKKIFNFKVALIFLFLWAINPLSVSADILSWNPLLVPLFTILIIYLLHRSEQIRRNNFTFISAGIVWAMGVSMHVQILLLAPFLFLFTLPKLKNTTYLFFGFIIPFVPIIFFDLKNNFINTKLLLNMLNTGFKKDYFSFLPVWDITSARLIGISPSRFVSVGIFVLLLFLLWKFKKDKIIRGLFWVVFFSPFAFAIYGQRPSEYYFNFIVVIMILISAVFLSRLKSRAVLFLCLFLMFIIFSIKSFEQLKDGVLGIYKKDQAVKFLQKATKDSSAFNVSYSIIPEGDSGFDYLMKFRNVKVSGSSIDPLIQLSSPSRQDSFAVGPIGIEFHEDWIRNNWTK